MRLERVPGAGSYRAFKNLDFLYPEGSGVSVEVSGSEDLEAKRRKDWEPWEGLTSPVGTGWQWLPRKEVPAFERSGTGTVHS